MVSPRIKILLFKIRKYFYFYQDEFFLSLIIVFGAIFLIFLGKYNLKTNDVLKPIKGGIYREGLYEEIESLTPFYIKNDSQKAILNLVFPSLIEFDNGKLISKFLKTFSFSKDSLTFNFELKNDLRWSDGEKVTSDDVALSFKMLTKEGSPELKSLFKDVEIEIIDEKKFTFHLKNTNNYFLFNLSNFRIFPQKILFQDSFEFPSFLKIGSGPFILESYKKNKDLSYLVLKRNEFYSPPAYLDRVIFYLFSSPKRAFDALFLKEIDGLAGLNYFNLPRNIFLNFRVYKIVIPRVIGLFFNSKKVNSQEVEVIDKMTNRDYLVNNIFKGFAEKSETIFSQTLRKVLNLPKEITYSSQKNIDNRQTSTKSLYLITQNSYFYPEIARYFKDKFNFKIEFLTNDDLNKKIKDKDYEVILTGINFSHPPFLLYFFSSTGLNLNNLENLELEKSFQSSISDQKLDLKKSIFEIENKILNLKMNIFLLNPAYLYFLSKNIYNFDQFYLVDPSERFVKIEYWYKK